MGFSENLKKILNISQNNTKQEWKERTEMQEGIDQSVLCLMDDIAFFRDIDNDFEDHPFGLDLKELEFMALKLLEYELGAKKGFERVNVVIIGNFSSGKSTFINSLLGKEICPMAIAPTTSSVTKFIYADKPEIILQNENNNKTISQEEYIKLSQHKGSQSKQFFFEYKYPFEHLRNIAIFDTPGFENVKGEGDTKLTEETLRKFGDVIFLVHDINTPDLQDSLLKKIKKYQQELPNTEWYLVLNKADQKSPKARQDIINSLKTKYGQFFKEFFVYSSLKVLKEANPVKVIDSVVSSVVTQMENAYKKQKNMEMLISGKLIEGKFASNYEFFVNGNTYKLPLSNGEFLKVRNSLLNILDIIANQKKTYLDRKNRYLKKEYEDKITEVIKQFTDFILKQKEENTFTDEDVNEYFNGIENILWGKDMIEGVRQLAQMLYHDLLSSYDVFNEELAEEHWFSDDEYTVEVNDEEAKKLCNEYIEELNNGILQIFKEDETIIEYWKEFNFRENLEEKIDKIFEEFSEIFDGITKLDMELLNRYKKDFSSKLHNAFLEGYDDFGNFLNLRRSLYIGAAIAGNESGLGKQVEKTLSKINEFIQKREERKC